MSYHPNFHRLRRRARCLALAALFLAPGGTALAIPTGTDSSRKSALLCRQAIAEAERAHRLPRQLLSALSIVESGRWSKARKEIIAWPWTIYAEGRGRYLKSKAAAIAEVRRLKARGVRNIDVGCMQVNLHYHPKAFANLSQAFEPRRNAAYAARFLANLKRETRSWSAAIGHYHSRTPKYAGPYRKEVKAAWRGERRRVAADRRNQIQARWQKKVDANKRRRYLRRKVTTSGRLYVRR